MDEDMGWLAVPAMVFGIAGAALLTWWTVVAFAGGRLWPVPMEVDGGIAFGLLWLFVIDPVVMTLLYWVGTLLLPLFAAGSWCRRGRRSHPDLNR